MSDRRVTFFFWLCLINVAVAATNFGLRATEGSWAQASLWVAIFICWAYAAQRELRRVCAADDEGDGRPD